MSTESMLAIIQLVNTLAQLAQGANISMRDLIKAKERATDEGRTFGEEDVDRLIGESKKAIEDFERRMKEYDDGDIA